MTLDAQEVSAHREQPSGRRETSGKNDLRRQILEAYEAINDAVERGDSETFRSLTTENHVSIATFGDPDMPAWQKIQKAHLQGYRRRIVSRVEVEALAPDVAAQRFDAELEGSFEGTPLPRRVATTIIYQRQRGQWHERFFQETRLQA